MNVSLKKLIGQYVYKDTEDEPWGRVKGISFADEGDRISSITLETLSLIPLSSSVPINEILDDGGKKLILQSEISVSRGIDNLMDSKISKAVYKNGKYSKIKDMRFDFETGEITDVIIGKGAFRRGEKIAVNKMYIKENTIYIE